VGTLCSNINPFLSFFTAIDFKAVKFCVRCGRMCLCFYRGSKPHFSANNLVNHRFSLATIKHPFINSLTAYMRISASAILIVQRNELRSLCCMTPSDSRFMPCMNASRKLLFGRHAARCMAGAKTDDLRGWLNVVIH
jgi:hypothetical protein